MALFVFKVISFFATSPYDTRASYIHGTGLDVEVVSAWCCGLMVSGSFFPTVAKKQFNTLAHSLASPRIVSFKYCTFNAYESIFKFFLMLAQWKIALLTS